MFYTRQQLDIKFQRQLIQLCFLCHSKRFVRIRKRALNKFNAISYFQAWIVERMGKFHRILEPGLNLLLPIVDRVKYVQSLKEIAIDVPKQSAITLDNVTLGIDGVLYLRILDPYLGKETELLSDP